MSRDLLKFGAQIEFASYDHRTFPWNPMTCHDWSQRYHRQGTSSSTISKYSSNLARDTLHPNLLYRPFPQALHQPQTVTGQVIVFDGSPLVAAAELRDLCEASLFV